MRFLRPQNVSGASHKNQDEVSLLLVQKLKSEVESFAVGGSLSSELPQ